MNVDKSTVRQPRRLNGTIAGAIVLALAFVVSLGISIRNTLRIVRPEKPVIYIAHWQLERGYREALQQIIDEYNRLHPEHEIRQTPVTQTMYAQWLNTQLISGTAPDICEMGNSKVFDRDESTVKYFLPLGSVITRPNIHNADNEMKDVPWKETLLDGMRGGFRENLQEYYGVPLTMLSMRIYYNKNLLARYGFDAPPRTFGQWMRMCDAIKNSPGNENGRVLPIVSCYDIVSIQNYCESSFTSGYEPIVDLNLNGEMNEMETYIACLQKKVSLDSPGPRAMFETLRAIGDNMQQGFSAMDRQQAQYRFVNELAVFMWTGSWDAAGTIAQARERGFEAGVIPLPLPAPDEPNGKYVRGHAGESMTGANAFGIYKQSAHTEQAIDFLMYLTSRRGNEKLNRVAQWPPVTIGAAPSELMKPFTADIRGYNSKLKFLYGSRMSGVIGSQAINYFQGDADFSSLKAIYEKTIVDPDQGGDWGWWFEYDESRRDNRNQERLLARQQAIALFDPARADPIQYRRALYQQAYRNNIRYSPYLFKKYRGKELRED